MATSFGALCTDFYINISLGMKMDLPTERDSVLHLFDRVRAELPSMDRFKRYPDELALESDRNEGQYRWLALRQRSVRAGHVNPDSMDDAFVIHKAVLDLAPYYVAPSPLDVDHLELTFGFDLECKANHNRIVHEALYADTPLSAMTDLEDARLTDVQPVFGFALDEDCRLRASVEVKTRTTPRQVRADRYRTEPISVYLTLKQLGPIDRLETLNVWLADMRQRAEQLANEKVAPLILSPINRAIIGSH